MKALRTFGDTVTIGGAVVLALGVTTLMLAAIDAPPGDVFRYLLQGAFGTLVEDGSLNLLNSRTADTLTFWVPLFLCSTGLLLTFTGGFWNIGIEGQMTMGAVAASFIALQIGTLALPAGLVMVVPAGEIDTTLDDLRGRPVGLLHPPGEVLVHVELPTKNFTSFVDAPESAAALARGDVKAVIVTPEEAERIIAQEEGLALGEGAITQHLPGWLLLPLSLAAAMVGGALWGLLCGVLRTRGGVHEIFGGVALNNLASIAAIYLIAGPWQPPEGGSAQSTPLFPEYTLLPRLEGMRLSPLMLVLALVLFAGVYLALRGTFWGLQLKAMGKNARSAYLLGVPTEKHALMAFTLCGALAGLAGSTRALGVYNSLRPNIAGGIGFLALLVVLLARVRGAWVPLVAFFFAAILSGSTQLKIKMQIDASLSGVIQGVLVLAVLIALGVRGRLADRQGESPAGEAAPQ